MICFGNPHQLLRLPGKRDGGFDLGYRAVPVACATHKELGLGAFTEKIVLVIAPLGVRR
jgi:hypothetical protein